METKRERVIMRGNRDERCYRDGHAFENGKPYFWNSVNGRHWGK